jgi:hypothetical protein
MKTLGASTVVGYRGVTPPQRNNEPSRPLVVPWPRTKQTLGPISLSGYRVSSVLRSSMRQWLGNQSNVTSCLQGALPDVAFAGISEPHDELKSAHASSEVTLGANGVLIFQSQQPWFSSSTHPAIVSATINGAGKLTPASMTTMLGNASYAPLLLGNSVATVGGGGQTVWLTAAADGSLGKTVWFGDVNDSASTLMAPGVILTSSLGTLTAKRLASDGTSTIIAKAALEMIDSESAPVMHNGYIVVFGRTKVQTVMRDGATFTLVDSIEHGLIFDGSMYPPCINENGLIVVGTRNGNIGACSVDASGKLRRIGHLAMGGKDRPAPVCFGDFIVTSDKDGDVRTLAVKNGEIAPVSAFNTKSSITARPTITRDGVVLIGTEGGTLHALQIGANGALAQLQQKTIGQPIRYACTVTPQGFVLVPGKTGLFSVGGHVS